ncbi:hypothetical protein DF139_36645, partial [Burkholderia stagnalis]
MAAADRRGAPAQRVVNVHYAWGARGARRVNSPHVCPSHRPPRRHRRAQGNGRQFARAALVARDRDRASEADDRQAATDA